MAGGLPVAAADVGGVPDLIAHETNGLLFDPTKEESMCAAVARLLSDHGKAAELADRAKEKALECFHPQKIAAKHLAIYRQVLDSAAAASLRPSSPRRADTP
jgi:glycosyltransferase involved in cell wall biosynthesis